MRLALLAVCVLAGLVQSTGWSQPDSAWPEWNDFVERFVDPKGRVVDIGFEDKSTSEGQAYGLFFALLANDRPRFDTLLNWTSRELAGGRLGERLPAWHWGRQEGGGHGVKDGNPASDADLWLAYTLLEAGRLWREPRYRDLGMALLNQVNAQEIAYTGRAGLGLLPGPMGFVSEAGVRLNPSYLPAFMLRYFADRDPDGPWQALWDDHRRLAPRMYARGVAPDMVLLDRQGQLHPDPDRGSIGSYDAIRVYLWAGLSQPVDAQAPQQLAGYAALVEQGGKPPEKADAATGKAIPGSFSPVGFSAAVLPLLAVLGEEDVQRQQSNLLRRALNTPGALKRRTYYDHSLILFGKGWADGRYRFDARGRLLPRWATETASTS